MNVVIIGRDIAAVVAGVCLAEAGHAVSLVDPAMESLGQYADDDVITSEPGLLTRIDKSIRTGRLSICSSVEKQAVVSVYWLFGRTGEQANIEQSLQMICASDNGKFTVVVSAYSPPGAHGRLEQLLLNHFQKTKSDMNSAPLVTLPIMVREGYALNDFEKPSLLILGTQCERSVHTVTQMLRPYINQANKSMVVPGQTAELIRNGINAILATRVSFINKLASVAERLGVDIGDVCEGIGGDPRIGGEYLSPGCGFGGTTLAGELENLASVLRKGSSTHQLIESVLQTNIEQKELLFQKVWRYFRADMRGKKIAIWGAAYKPGTSSLSGSPVHDLLQAFWAQGVTTVVYDPKANGNVVKQYDNQPLLVVEDNAYTALKNVDALLVVTAWPEFYNPDFAEVQELMKQPLIFDGRNIYEPGFMQELGFEYFGIGRGLTI